MLSFIIWLGLCLALYIAHTLVHLYDLRAKDGELLHRLEVGTFFLAWLIWVGLVLAEQPGIPGEGEGFVLFLVGIFQTLAGLAMIGWGLLENPDFGYRDGAHLKGIHAKFLHPIYYGMILVLLGVPAIASSSYALYSSPIWIAFILFYMLTENRFLELRLGEKYRQIEGKVLI